ncbi:hypothetical protein TNCV_4597761 [Trichonephila clavipes]|nr:hypothetical protein TNCV_4597761 [Trichonephila clavipes]
MDHNPLKAKTVGGQFNGISCNIGPKGRNLGTREVPDVTPADTTAQWLKWLEHRTTPLQVQGSNPGLGKVGPAFHENQASLGNNTGGFRVRLATRQEHLLMHLKVKVTYTELGTVGLGPHGLLRHCVKSVS